LEFKSNHPDQTNELLNELRKIYKSGGVHRSDTCRMADHAVAYAFDELNAGLQHEMKDHLLSCQSCLEMVIDIRTADSEVDVDANATEKQALEISNVIYEKIHIAAPRRVLNRLLNIMSGTLNIFWQPKLIAGMATAGVILFAVYAIRDPGSDMPPESVRQKILKPDRAIDTKTSINVIQPEVDNIPTPEKRDRKAKKRQRIPRSPLVLIDLDNLNLVGIVVSETGNKAMFEDPSGKGYLVIEGMYIGNKLDKVVAILKDRVIIEAMEEDISGKKSNTRREIRLQTKRQ
jgi:type IV pilus assembly protein PilP